VTKRIADMSEKQKEVCKEGKRRRWLNRTDDQRRKSVLYGAAYRAKKQGVHLVLLTKTLMTSGPKITAALRWVVRWCGPLKTLHQTHPA